MKKVIRFVKRNSLNGVLILAIGFVLVKLYDLLHIIATNERGYEAIGGELTIFVLPVIAYAIYDTIKETRAERSKK